MTKEIHGHDIIQMMTESNQLYTRDSLKAAILAKFGADARFHTCSAEGMDADGIIDFLAARGKFMENVAGLAINPDQVCNHNH
jgi:probable metal-binding protein